MLLESKNGTWEHLAKKWTQLPKYDEDEPKAMCIETSNRFLAIDNKEVKLLRKNESVCQKWTRSKAVDGYFAFKTEHDNMFLTVEENLSLKIDGKGQISTDHVCLF